MKIRAVVRYCLTPKSPDEPLAVRVRSDTTQRWTVCGDQDYPPNNRLGWEDVYYGLSEHSFTPGCILVEVRDGNGKPLGREWHVQVRHNRKLGDVLDAWCEWHGETLWLRHDVFGGALTTPVEQMVLV